MSQRSSEKQKQHRTEKILKGLCPSHGVKSRAKATHGSLCKRHHAMQLGYSRKRRVVNGRTRKYECGNCFKPGHNRTTCQKPE